MSGDKMNLACERPSSLSARSSLRLIRDVHDTHKHGPLGRKNAKIRSGNGHRKPGGTVRFKPMLFRKTRFKWEPPPSSLSKTIHYVDEVIDAALGIWNERLKRPSDT
jgi:hypothetical protein